MSTAPKTYLTQADYLRLERAAEGKSEFYRGEMFAMAGASREHYPDVSVACESPEFEDAQGDTIR